MGSVGGTEVTETTSPGENSAAPSSEKSIPDVGEEGVSSCSSNGLCYQPISTFEELMKYGEVAEGEGSGDGNHRASACKEKTIPFSSMGFGDFKIAFNGKPVGKDGKYPKTLVCHDMKGGYGDDRFVDGTNSLENYSYRHWFMTDIFVYFAHKFITIPTLGWINAAHSHGVKILGTIITEWDDGIELCTKMLASPEAIARTVEKLCMINEDYGFDGYLLNIENKLEGPGMVDAMVEFTRKLTAALKKQSSKNLVIWYDSVTKEGDLKWQDALNEKNKIFFDVCDGIYLNYNWNDEKLQNSAALAGDRCYDVYVGIDCWGRGCWGGGGVNTCLAVDKIFGSGQDFSYAIFAPGWTFECHSFQEYPFMDDELWTRCLKQIRLRCLVGSSTLGLISGKHANPDNCDDKTSDTTAGQFKVFFATDFCRGYGAKRFSFGQVASGNPWFDLSKQSFQPVIISSAKCLEFDCRPAQERLAKLACEAQKKEKEPEKPSSILIGSEPKVFYDTENGFSGGGGLTILNSKKRKDFEDPLTSSPIWIPLRIPVTAKRLTVATVAVWKSVSINHQLKIYLELGKDGSPDRKILLGSLDSLATSVRGKFFIQLRLSQFLRGLPVSPSAISDFAKSDLEFYFQKNNYDEKELSGWRVSCFLFDIDQVYDEYSSIKALRVGADGDITVGFLSLGQITHYQQ